MAKTDPTTTVYHNVAKPGGMVEASKPKADTENTDAAFILDVKQQFADLETEISERNEKITERDGYIYGDMLERSIDVPVGHDHTPVNWLRRTVEIHKNMFMSRGFQVVSTYDTKDLQNVTDNKDRNRVETENRKAKEFAEARQNLIRAIQEDNGGDALWSMLAESASAVGDAAIKLYYDTKAQKIELCPIESIENLYVLWSTADFRKIQAVAYVEQVSKATAVRSYGADENVPTAPAGQPGSILTSESKGPSNSTQPMVNVIEVTGIIEGWGVEKGKVKRVPVGQETELNAMIVGDKVTRMISDQKKLPKYYILPNKRQRRRPWGISDVSDAAININQTYIETLSDWRTVASKVNFPKYKAFGFGPDTELPKPESRKVQYLPLTGEGQDIVPLQEGDSNSLDWGRQLDECKEQFVRETGLSRVLFDDPSVTLNSNQALLTSMKPTSDIAEAKKQLWAPIICQLFKDALELAAANLPELSELVSDEDNWTLKVMWPSVMQKEDPVYQSMLLNRFNAGTMSIQSYVEAQGESKEEIDRLRSELTDPVTAAILGKQLPMIAQQLVNAATAEIQAWYQSMLPQPEPAAGGANTPGVNSNGGTAVTAPVAGPADNVAAPVSQPGSGASATSAQGALAQTNQVMGG